MSHNSKLETALKEKYGEEFIVREDTYQFELGVNIFIASPKAIPELKFEGRQKDGVLIMDYYPEVLWNYEAENLLKQQLNSEKIPIFVKCFVTGRETFDNNNQLIHFDQMMRNLDTTVSIEFIVYFFEDINESNKNTLLGCISNIANEFNKGLEKDIYFSIYFWDKNFTSGKKIKNMKFTTNVDEWKGQDYPKEFGYENDDNTQCKQKYIRHNLRFEFRPKVNFDFTINALYSLIKIYDIKDVKSIIINKDGSIDS